MNGLPADPGQEGPGALEAFLEAAPDAIVFVDAAGRVVSANRLAARMFGYSRQELLRRRVELLVPDWSRADPAGRRGSLPGEAPAGPPGEGRELSGRRKDGTEFALELRL